MTDSVRKLQASYLRMLSYDSKASNSLDNDTLIDTHTDQSVSNSDTLLLFLYWEPKYNITVIIIIAVRTRKFDNEC